MDINETVKCLQLILDCVVLDKRDSYFTILSDIHPSSFEFVLHEAIYHLESISDK